ncbi:unnamed protein product [Heterobilharzia americana]|nr:unnamed protein product [Heterobilharzia americana]
MVSDNGVIQPVAQYGHSNGVAVAYHPAHLSPQKTMPLAMEQQQNRGEHTLPPVPPPRSPQMPGSNITLRRNYATNMPLGLVKYNEPSTSISADTSESYPQPHSYNELMNSQPNFNHNSLQQNDDQFSEQSSNTIQTPLRIDLRGQSESDTDIASKQNRMMRNGLGVGLPPLASNHIHNRSVNIQPSQKSNSLSETQEPN